MRISAAGHHETFQQAFIDWRMPQSDEQRADAAHVAKALERWLAEYPGNADLLQQFAAGAAAVAELEADWAAAQRIAEVGLSASQVGALAPPGRLYTSTLLALQATRAAMELARLAAARQFLEQAGETVQHVRIDSALGQYMHWQLHLLAGELSEAALERAAAVEHFDRAVAIARRLESDSTSLDDLVAAWVEMLYGHLPKGQTAQAAVLMASERTDLRTRSVLGLARSSRSPESARSAVDLCATQGLPQRDPVLVTQGILSRLPPDEIDGAAERLLALARDLREPWRSTWLIALHAQHAEAWLVRGDTARARMAVDAAARQNPQEADAVSVCLGFVSRVRVATAEGDTARVRELLDALLPVRALTSRRMEGSRWGLQFRVACEPALQAGVRAEAQRLHERSDAAARRILSRLVDGLRSPQEGMPHDDAAGDRIGRLASALARDEALESWLVLVLQSVGEATLLVAIGGDEAQPVLVTPPDRTLHDALVTLTQRSADALQVWVEDGELQALGRSAYDALPAVVRQRVQRAGTLVVVPDLGVGQDRAPIELLHDGDEYLGASRIITRCLSLTHALRVVEAPLVAQPPGRHALCVSVSQPPGWPTLEFADTERQVVGQALRARMWDVAELSEVDAQPRTVLELLPLAHLVHVACHGEASAGAEALVLGGGVRLTALEFGTRHPVRCVTYLNACSLARGRYVGGGVSRGVAYAFARAGAPAVLSNLLPVEDESAAQLAEAFYLAASHMPVGDALRRARQQLQPMVSPALWSPTVLLGDPRAWIDGRADERRDATAELFDGAPLPQAARLAAAKKRLAHDPDDVRLAAALRFSATLAAGEYDQLEPMADLAQEIGHDIGEAHCLVALADALPAGDDEARRSAVLTRAVAALEPLRNAWKPALEAHTRLQRELRELDPTYRARELVTVRTPSGMSVNDRSDPAVNAVLGIYDAMHEHEAFWRGGPRLHQPDSDLVSAAHNAVVWGYVHQLYGSGAEAAYAAQCAQRLAWRGLVPEACVPNLQRVLAGLLHFLWGQHGVKHLEHWMESAHTQVILLALRNVQQHWLPPEASTGAGYARELSAALDRAVGSMSGSKFSRARAALRGGAATTGAQIPELDTSISQAVEQCRQTDPFAAAELAAWVLGDVLQRIDATESASDARLDALHVYRGLVDAIDEHAEAWFMPYLMEGFADVRNTGGQDLFARWSRQML
jgi:CHAT domain-containing protein